LIFTSSFFYKNQVLSVFIERLPIIVNIFLILSIYITFLSFRVSYQTNVNNQTLEMMKKKSELNLILQTNITKCPNFINSLRYTFQVDSNTLENYFKTNNSKTEEDEISIHYISMYIFQMISMYLTTAEYTSESDSSWLAFFGSLFNSKKLIEEYNTNKYSLSIKTRKLIERLIKINQEQVFKNSKEVIDFFDTFVLSSDFSLLLETQDITNVTQKIKAKKEI
jgi:hypothetical protein